MGSVRVGAVHRGQVSLKALVRKSVNEIENIYEEPQPVWEKEVFEAIENNDVDRLRLIPIELGFHHENWKFIQDISVRLSDHEDAWVRANSLLGIEYAARFRGR